MKWWKLMVHSIPAAALFAALLALLLFYLNPRVPLSAATMWATWLPLVAAYGALAALAWPAGLLALRFFAARPLDLRWLQFSLFHRFHLVNLAVALGIWWANFLATSALLAPEARRLLLAGCSLQFSCNASRWSSGSRDPGAAARSLSAFRHSRAVSRHRRAGPWA